MAEGRSGWSGGERDRRRACARRGSGAGRWLVVAPAAMLLAGCSFARVEDVPSAAVIDGRTSTAVASLATPPPDFLTTQQTPVPASATDGTDEATDAEDLALADQAEPPNGFTPGALPDGATWLVRYGDDGFDAEDADGNYCSGQILDGDSTPRPGLRVKLACNGGDMAQLVVGSGSGGAQFGAIMRDGESQKAVIR
jgi:hypothetical protein